jgi:hypothetical protein
MIISRGRKFVFVHIPKTGGTALSLALEDRAMKDDILIGDTPKAQRRRHRLKGLTTRGRLRKHATLSDIDGLLSLEELSGFFTFTLVRNPWNRVVSYYHWLRQQTFSHSAVTLAKSTDFRSFATHGETVASLKASPARYYMRRADGAEQCSAYIRLEHFGSDGAPLFDHLGFRPALGRTNTSERHADWRCYYDDVTKRAVEKACAEDIEQFGYRFDDPAS